MHRFHDGRQSQRPDLDIRIFVGPSFDYDIETLKGVARLRERRSAKFQIVNLGVCPSGRPNLSRGLRNAAPPIAELKARLV